MAQFYYDDSVPLQLYGTGDDWGPGWNNTNHHQEQPREYVHEPDFWEINYIGHTLKPEKDDLFKKAMEEYKVAILLEDGVTTSKMLKWFEENNIPLSLINAFYEKKSRPRECTERDFNTGKNLCDIRQDNKRRRKTESY